MTKRLFLIDGNYYLNRAYYATSPMTAPNGEPTNAIRGFLNILMADLAKIKPTHFCIVFDKGGKPNWRCEHYPRYKQNRQSIHKKTDKKSLERRRQMAEMKSQIPNLKAILKSLGFRTVNKAGVEGDDLLATLATEYAAKGWEIIIGTKDKDIMQLVGGDIRVMRPDRKLYGQLEVFKEFGVKPNQIIDYLALVGDSVDNIEGVKGCGPKTARLLLEEFDSLSSIVKNRKKLKPAMSKAIKNAKDYLKVARKIIRLKTDETHKVKTSQLVFPNEAYDEARLKKLCKKLGLKHTFNQLENCRRQWTAESKTSGPKSKAAKLW